MKTKGKVKLSKQDFAEFRAAITGAFAPNAALQKALERAAKVKDFIKRMRWKAPYFQVSALAREGLDPMVQAIYEHVAAHKVQAPPVIDPRFDVAPVVARPEEPIDD